jgi:hypothetical protein
MYKIICKYIFDHLSHNSDFYNVLLCFALTMRCFSGNFQNSRRQFVAPLTAMYSHKFPNLKFEGDAPQAECVARVEKGFVSASQPNS